MAWTWQPPASHWVHVEQQPSSTGLLQLDAHLIHCLAGGLSVKCPFHPLVKASSDADFQNVVYIVIQALSCSASDILQILNLCLTFVVQKLQCVMFPHSVNPVLLPCRNKFLFSRVSALPPVCEALDLLSLPDVCDSVHNSFTQNSPCYLSGSSRADITTTINFPGLEVMKAHVENCLSGSFFLS